MGAEFEWVPYGEHSCPVCETLIHRPSRMAFQGVKYVATEIEFKEGTKTRVNIPVVNFPEGKFKSGDPKWNAVVKAFDKVRDEFIRVHLEKLEKAGAEIPASATYESVESPVETVIRKVASRDQPAGTGTRLKPGDNVEYMDAEQLSPGDPVRYFFGRTVFADRGTYGVKAALVRDVLVNRAWSTSQGRDRALAPGVVQSEEASSSGSGSTVTPGVAGVAGAAVAAKGKKKKVVKVAMKKKVAMKSMKKK